MSTEAFYGAIHQAGVLAYRTFRLAQQNLYLYMVQNLAGWGVLSTSTMDLVQPTSRVSITAPSFC